MENYLKGLEAVKVLPKFYLGQEVITALGRGIIVKIEMPFNGLYISPERGTAVVWFSTMGLGTRDYKWITFSFKLNELHEIRINGNN